MRRNIVLAFLLLAIVLFGGGMYFLAMPREEASEPAVATTDESDESAVPKLSYATVPVTAGGKTYQLQLADSPEKQSLGLGQRKSLGGDGMIFPYAKPQKLCFWMKDMKFSIDMLWLDANKQVLKLQADVSPDTYPKTTYCQADAQYVVELDAGEAQKHVITVGSKLDFAL